MVKTVTVDRRAYLSRDGRVVFGGPDVDRLLFTKGQEIDIRTAEKYGLIQHRDPAPVHRDPEPVIPPAPPAPQVEPEPIQTDSEIADELTAPVKRRGRPPKSRV